MKASSKSKKPRKGNRGNTPVEPPPTDNTEPRPAPGPQFAQPTRTTDPAQYTVKHASDTAAYAILDKEKGLKPRPFPPAKDPEPTLTLANAIGGSTGAKAEASIQKAGQIVFHVAGDTGNTAGPKDGGMVADKMVSDFSEANSAQVPSFFYHLGDAVYSFGEAEYYYDQFYDIYRDYPAPIFAIPGNHDGMVAPNVSTPTLASFLSNFCTAGQAPHCTPEAGGLARTAQVQPAVYFTLEAPFARILGLYSNCLEDPGIISDQGGKYPYLGQFQIDFLKAALARIKQEKFAGAVVIAVHHPPYVAQLQPSAPGKSKSAGKHGGSPEMLKEIDAACSASGVWPHAVLSGHAHNYQRFTRTKGGRQTPYIVCGNGGHAVSALTKKGTPAIRVPLQQTVLSDGSDTVEFENYDDQDFGYLRVLVNAKQLRIEYHPASDGAAAKTPDDNVTVDLASYKIVRYNPPE
jgi:hypothetical protein